MSARLCNCMASAVRMLTPNSSSTAAMKPRLATESHSGTVLCDASAPTLSSEVPMTSASKEASFASSASGDTTSSLRLGERDRQSLGRQDGCACARSASEVTHADEARSAAKVFPHRDVCFDR